jgi:hypothetical protein
VTGSRAEPNRLYAAQHTGWFGQIIQRSSDGGATREAVGNQFGYDGVPGTHQCYDGTRLPDAVAAGTEPFLIMGVMAGG